MTTPRTNENRNGLRFRNAALCAAFGALSAMSFIVSGENYQGISDPPASSAGSWAIFRTNSVRRSSGWMSP